MHEWTDDRCGATKEEARVGVSANCAGTVGYSCANVRERTENFGVYHTYHTPNQLQLDLEYVRCSK